MGNILHLYASAACIESHADDKEISGYAQYDIESCACWPQPIKAYRKAKCGVIKIEDFTNI